MRTDTPLATCSVTTEWAESAASAQTSSPRFIGPGCMRMAPRPSAASRSAFRPNWREYSSGEGKKPPPALDMRSRWTRSIMTASGLRARTSSSV